MKALICRELSCPEADIGVLKIVQRPEPWPYLSLDTHERVKIKDNIRSFGYPEGSLVTGVEILGQIGGLSPTEIAKVEVLSIEGLSLHNINPGYSGGPVLNDETQRVIGLIRMKHTDTQGFFTQISKLFQTWPDLRDFHDVYQKLREHFVGEAQHKFYAELKETPFISLSIEQGVFPESIGQSGTISIHAQELNWESHKRRWETVDLVHLTPPKKNYLLSSDVGTGKTTFIYWLAMELAKKIPDILPLVISCSELESSGAMHWSDLKRWLIHSHDYIFKKDLEDFLEWGREGHFVFLFDGLDQIKSRNYTDLARKTFAIAGRNSVLITSRPSAVLTLEDDRSIQFLRLKPFSSENQRLYFGGAHTKAMAIAQFAPELARIPMLAYMIRTLIDEEKTEKLETRTEVYKKFIEHILCKHEPINAISAQHRFLTWKVERGLRALAYTALTQPEPQIQKIEENLAFGVMGGDAEELHRFGLVNHVLDKGKHSFLFTHQSFQEFLAALYLAEDKHQDEMHRVLAERWNPKWEQVIRFLVGLTGEQTLEALIKGTENAIYTNLFLAASCLCEVKTVSTINIKRIELGLVPLVAQIPFRQDALRAISLGGCKSNPLDSVLIEALLKQLNVRNMSDQEEIAEVLGKQLTHEYVDALIKHLEDKHSNWRSAIVKVLGIWGKYLTSVQVDAVAELLRDKDKYVRRQAVEVLGRSNEQLMHGHVNTLIGRLTDRDVRDEAVKVLGRYGRHLTFVQVDTVANLLSAGNENLLVAAMKILGKLGELLTPVQVNMLIKQVEDQRSNVRTAARNALHELSEYLTFIQVDAIANLLSDKDVEVRIIAVEVLGEVGERLTHRQMDTLIGRLEDESLYVRDSAVTVLSKLGNYLTSVQVDSIANLLRAKDKYICIAAVRLIRMSNELYERLTPAHMNMLVVLWDDKEREVRSAILGHMRDTLIKQLRPPQVVDALIERSEGWEMSCSVMGLLETWVERLTNAQIEEIIEHWGDEKIRRFSMMLNSKNHPTVRDMAARVLMRLAGRLTPARVAALVEWLDEEEDWHIRFAATRAVVIIIGSCKPSVPGQVNTVAKWLKDDYSFPVIEGVGKWNGEQMPEVLLCALVEHLGNKHAYIRKAVIEALIKAHKQLDPSQVNVLIERLGDRDLDVSKRAMEILQMLGERLTSTQVESIIKWLRYNDEEVRINAVCALEGVNSLTTDQVAIITTLLVDKNLDMRHKSYFILKHLYQKGVPLPAII